MLPYRSAVLPAAFALLAAAAPLAVFAQNGGAAKSFDPKAESLLQKAADRMKAAKTFSGKLTVITVTNGTKRSEARSVGVFHGQKPNLVFQEEGPQTKNADGTWTTNVSQRSVYDGKTGVMFLPNSTFVKIKDKPEVRPQSYSLSFPEFFSSRFSFAQQVRDMKTRGELTSLRTARDETFGGTPCFVVEGKTLIRQYANGKKDYSSKKFYIGKTDYLLRGIHAVTPSPSGTEIFDAIVSDIAINQKIPASVFAVNLDGYSPYAKRKPGVEPKRPALLAAGTVAPDFTAYNKDGKAVKLSDYKGMVVVLDFWATWCGPCMASLPHTTNVAKKTADKGVVVLAVNVWDKKEEFDKWLPKHPEFSPLVFAIDTTPGQGQDVATKLYKVSGIPTQYVIGRDGKIVTSFVGYGGPTNDLEKAIEKADKRATIAQK